MDISPFSKIPKSQDSPTGFLLLGEYSPLKILGEGGMGQVYLVSSLSTGSQFALKRAKYVNNADRKNFLTELQTWIDLPDHPNLAACRFFRTLGDEVLIFAEYVNGGSLRDWIDLRKLYEGGPNQALERMLDVSIQLAWGLHCLHGLGAIHQDVKPANVLMASDNLVGKHGVKPQVADFGLARARAAAGEDFDPNGSTLVSTIRGTPAYWSPEQSQGKPITHKADIWSWGLSVMEMFTGGVTWMSGLGAAEVLEQYLQVEGESEDGIPLMPKDLSVILRECFNQDPLERPVSLGNTVKKLQKIYQDCVGFEYARTLEIIEKPTSLQDGINERKTRTGAIWMDPKLWLKEALTAAGRSPGGAASIVEGRGSTRTGFLVADIAVYDEAKGIFEELIQCEQSKFKPNLARLCINKALVHQTAGDVHGAIAEYNRAIDILKESAEESGDVGLAIGLVHAYVQKAHVLNDYTTDHLAAFDSYKRATNALELLVNVYGRRDLENNLASYYSNMAGSAHLIGNSKEAVVIYDKALAIKERLVNQTGRRDLAGDLARTYMNKSNVIRSLGDNAGAIALCDQAILILEQLTIIEGRSELDNDWAHVYAIKASSLGDLGDNKGAIVLYDKALAIREKLVDQKGRKELANDLACTFSNKANAARELGDKHVAMALYAKAIAIRERLVNQEGQIELSYDLATDYTIMAEVASELGEFNEALDAYNHALAIRERLTSRNSGSDLTGDLATIYTNIGSVLNILEEGHQAITMFEKAIAIQEPLVNTNGLHEILGDLARSKGYHGLMLLNYGEVEQVEQALEEIEFSLKTLQDEFSRTGRVDLKEAFDWLAYNVSEFMNAE